MEPSNANLIYQLCQVYSKKGYYTVGIRHCRKAISLKPEFYEAINRLAWLYSKKKTNLDEAIKLSEKTLQVFPNNAGYIDTLSEIYYVRGETIKAIDNIKRAIKLAPKESYYKQQLWKFKNVLPNPIKG